MEYIGGNIGEYIGENNILEIINDNLKNTYPNAKLKNVYNIPYQYSIVYYVNNIDEHYSHNMFYMQPEYIQNDIKNIIINIVRLYFDKEVIFDIDSDNNEIFTIIL
jgi:hypothetical protein